MRAIAWRLSVCFIFFAFLSGCILEGAGGVRGPAPVMDAGQVEAASANTYRILSALAADANLNPNAPASWYSVAEAGFNYVDGQCTAYFDQLFFLNRQREATKSAISSFGQTTNAIMGVTGASTVSLAVVAQAFGLASAVTDIVAGTYLFQLPPATTKEFIGKLQRAFRDGASAKRDSINRPTVAYNFIQDYLSLCLPPTIEARLIDHIASAEAAPVSRGAGAGISVQIGSRETVNLVAPLTPITSARERLLSARPPVQTLKYTLGPVEPRLNPTIIAQIQRALCIDVSSELGPKQSVTRKGIVEFFKGKNEDRSSILMDGLTWKDVGELTDAVESIKDCKAKGYKTPAEVGRALS